VEIAEYEAYFKSKKISIILSNIKLIEVYLFTNFNLLTFSDIYQLQKICPNELIYTIFNSNISGL